MQGRRRNIFRAAGLLLIFLSGLGAVQPVQAQSAGTLGIVVIDTQAIYRESEAVKGLQKRIDDQRSAYQEELRRKEESLRAADQELARQRTILSAEAFAQKRQELEEQVATLQGEIQSRRKGLEKQFAQGMKQVQATLVEIAREIAEEREVDLVIEKGAVVLVRPELEITPEVLKRLNQRLPKVKISAPQN
jgi:Skp family chaperone for outer membrane proteins